MKNFENLKGKKMRNLRNGNEATVVSETKNGVIIITDKNIEKEISTSYFKSWWKFIETEEVNSPEEVAKQSWKSDWSNKWYTTYEWWWL